MVLNLIFRCIVLDLRPLVHAATVSFGNVRLLSETTFQFRRFLNETAKFEFEFYGQGVKEIVSSCCSYSENQ